MSFFALSCFVLSMSSSAVPAGELASKVEAGLPASLVLADLTVRGTMPADARDVAVLWRQAPRAGTMLVRAGYSVPDGTRSHVWVALRIEPKPAASAVSKDVAPIARGTDVKVLVRVGRATVSAAGVLEKSARPGEPTAARLKQGARLVRGVLVDAQTVVVDGGAL